MDWLTPEQVKAYATTPKKALEISIKHWWQNRTATKEELRAFAKGSVPFSAAPCISSYCGLCRYYYDMDGAECVECPVTPCCDADLENDNDTPWQTAVNAYWQWERNMGSYSAWIKAATAMHKYLCSLR